MVGVEQDAPGALGALPVGQDGGPPGHAPRPRDGQDLGLQPGLAQEAGHVPRGAGHLGLVVAVGRDRGDGHQVGQVGDDRREGVVDGGADGVHAHGGGGWAHVRRVSRATGYPGDVKLFKKHDEAPPEDPAPSPAPLRPGQSARKGRPTPKRRQAQARGVHPVVPTDRKEARRQERAARDAAWKRQQEGMRAGDEHYMPTRDKGAIKRYIRDYVDAR